MKRKFTSLQKDSEQLVIERKKITDLTLDMTKALEKEEAASQIMKEAQKKCKKSESSLAVITADFEDLKKKHEFTEEKYTDL